MKLFQREIRLCVLFSRGACYRAFIIVMNFLFNIFAIKGTIKLLNEHYFGVALGYTIIWNIINTGLYYLFHYGWDRTFKMGKDK